MACINRSCFNICLETKLNPNGGAEITVRCNDDCSSDFNVIPFTACFNTTLNNDFSFSTELAALIKR
ncbi:hypothetical protein ACIGHG_03295 [Bacillus sp. NPDC077411]|uniref:Uncharacterized protein n=1 Tax=Bacillus bruguierae TaxID=3127667 RepID=A0ABU8FGA4_9BACI|nr:MULTISPECIES: hypothetical protein [unclassified Bacillus (in: firmicutes)]SFJ73636.1 hypothetical protein SAMN04488574_1259 [Bacillus sp. 71mf]SFS69420.1 hypothetical protein SAMN04488145_102586 [Bacillus sp. 103mf]